MPSKKTVWPLSKKSSATSKIGNCMLEKTWTQKVLWCLRTTERTVSLHTSGCSRMPSKRKNFKKKNYNTTTKNYVLSSTKTFFLSYVHKMSTFSFLKFVKD